MKREIRCIGNIQKVSTQFQNKFLEGELLYLILNNNNNNNTLNGSTWQ